MTSSTERNAFWQRQAERYTREAAKAQDEATRNRWTLKAANATKEATHES